MALIPYPVLPPSLISHTVSVEVKHHERKKKKKEEAVARHVMSFTPVASTSGQSYLDKSDVSYPVRAEYRVTELTI